MSQSASPRRGSLLLGAAVLLAVAVVVAAALWLKGGDEKAAAPVTGASSRETSSTTPTTAPPTTAEPTDAPSTTPTCEGDDTQFNVAGTDQDSLLPDCGVAPVTTVEEKQSGLDLACGGTYPVILYKTTTSGAKTSVCGVDSSGVDFRIVTKPSGGDIVDISGTYDPGLDAFVGRSDGTTYTVQAYDGALLVRRDGTTTKQPSSDWISLDNEPDGD